MSSKALITALDSLLAKTFAEENTLYLLEHHGLDDQHLRASIQSGLYSITQHLLLDLDLDRLKDKIIFQVYRNGNQLIVHIESRGDLCFYSDETDRNDFQYIFREASQMDAGVSFERNNKIGTMINIRIPLR